jgi:hypothetical protein
MGDSSMKRGRPKKHRDPYDGYEALDPKVGLPELVKATRGRPKKITVYRDVGSMTAAEIAVIEARIKRARIIAENSEKDRLRAAIRSMAKQHGFNVEDLISR